MGLFLLPFDCRKGDSLYYTLFDSGLLYFLDLKYKLHSIITSANVHSKISKTHPQVQAAVLIKTACIDVNHSKIFAQI